MGQSVEWFASLRAWAMLTMLWRAFTLEVENYVQPSDAAFQAWLQGIEDHNLPNVQPLPGFSSEAVEWHWYNATELGNLSNLQQRYLYDNWLSDNDISTWHGVSVSDGSVTAIVPVGDINQLTGEIPTELGNLSNLQLNCISTDNQLSGEIPKELGNLTNLERLFLRSTQLSGALPQNLTRLTKLERFYFQDTGLCAPLDAAFQAWLQGIANTNGSNCSG